MSKITKRQLITLNSDLKSSGSKTNFVVKIPNYDASNPFTHCALLKCLASKSYFMINDNIDGFTHTETTGSVSRTAYLDHGVYTGAELATMVATVLTTSSAAGGNSFTYTGSFDTNYQQISIQCSSAEVWTMTFEFPAIINPYLGFGVEDLTLSSNAAGKLFGVQPVNLERFSQIDIHCNLVNNNGTNYCQSLFPSPFPYFTDIEYTNHNANLQCFEIWDKKTNELRVWFKDIFNQEIPWYGWEGTSNAEFKLQFVLWREE